MLNFLHACLMHHFLKPDEVPGSGWHYGSSPAYIESCDTGGSNLTGGSREEANTARLVPSPPAQTSVSFANKF
jgi:hypothetical protein